MFIFNDSKIREKCALHAVCPRTDKLTPAEQHYLQLFGNPVYRINFQVLSPYSGEGERTQDKHCFNVAMASMRIEVEHGFAIVLNSFLYLNLGGEAIAIPSMASTMPGFLISLMFIVFIYSRLLYYSEVIYVIIC